jgi:hypothetical protein
MWLGSDVGGGILDLATAVHIVKLVGYVVGLAFTAIELVSMHVFERLFRGVNEIVAIPAVEHVMAPIKVGQR